MPRCGASRTPRRRSVRAATGARTWRSSPTPARRPTSSPPLPCAVARSPWPGWDRRSVQGDARFADVLARMGATVAQDGGHHHRVRRRAPAGRRGRHGRALRHRPDPGGGGAVRHDPDAGHGHRLHPRQGDRPDRRRRSPSCGGAAWTPRSDPTDSWSGPGTPHGAQVRTYDDHRMAMSFALLGLAVPGIEITDPGASPRRSPATGTSSTRPSQAPGRLPPRC